MGKRVAIVAFAVGIAGAIGLAAWLLTHPPTAETTAAQPSAVSSAATATAAVPAGGSHAATSAPRSDPEDLGASEVTLTKAGAQLPRLRTPPANMISILPQYMVTANALYNVQFEVFGIGPAATGKDGLVIQVTSSSPAGRYPKVYELSGRSVIVGLEGRAGDSVKTGGAYRGRLKLVPYHGILYFVLLSAQPR